MLNERRYVTFIPQEDNANDQIQAEDINELQRTVEDIQEEQFRQADRLFLETCLTTLEHHTDVNSMILDLLEDTSKINSSTMVNVRYDEDIHSILLDEPGATTGKVMTSIILNETTRAMTNICLLVDQYTPAGTNIEYEFSYDGLTFYSITPGSSQPINIPEPYNQILLRVSFSRSSDSVKPRLDAWAILYADETYEFKFVEDGIEYAYEKIIHQFEFEQKTPSNIWIIKHNMNKKPNVTILDQNGNLCFGRVEYINEDEVHIKFSDAISGIAYLN